jgi:ParB-like chromosome segregation protein Spo0J
MEIQTWPVSKLVPYFRNPRKKDPPIERMAASITQFGFKVPILARSSGEIVDGDLRLKAAVRLGIQELPVILCDEWSIAQVKAFRLLVNRSVTWAEWDEDLVAIEIGELKALDFDLSLTGFDPVEIDEFLFGEEKEDVPDAAFGELS